jgi:hypothetical protein
VAAEGRGGKAELPGQGAIGHRLPEAAVDLRAGGVVADGTAFYHSGARKQEFPRDAGWIAGYLREGRGASKGGIDGEERVVLKRKGDSERRKFIF